MDICQTYRQPSTMWKQRELAVFPFYIRIFIGWNVHSGGNNSSNFPTDCNTSGKLERCFRRFERGSRMSKFGSNGSQIQGLFAFERVYWKSIFSFLSKSNCILIEQHIFTHNYKLLFFSIIVFTIDIIPNYINFCTRVFETLIITRYSNQYKH